MSCCPPGSWDGPLDQSGAGPSQAGTLLKIGDATPAYHTGISGEGTSGGETKTGIVVFPDVWGMLDRTKLICDTLASQGHEVVLFDPFRGETKADHPDDTALAWLKSVPYEPNVAKDVEACVAFLLSKGVDQTRIGALGFCWGAWAISKATCSGFDFKCSVWAHPSTGIERRVFNRDEDAMIRGVRMPVLVMCAGNDDERLKNGGELAQLIQLRGGRSHDFPDMIHGFATRCDTSIPENRRDAEKALTLASTFFAEHLPS